MRSAAVTTLIFILSTTVGNALAVTYQFERVALKQPGTIDDFGNFSLNNVGQVAYDGILPNGSESIFRWTQGQTVELLREGDLWSGQPIAVPSRVSLNDSGSIAVSAVKFTGHQSGLTGVFRLDGSTLTKIAPLQTVASFFSDSLDLANNGRVTYDAQISGSSGANVYAGDGQTVQTLYSGSLSPLFPRANEAGVTVFTGFSGNSVNPYQTLLINGLNTMVIASGGSGAQPRFDSLAGAKINNQSRIVFIGHILGETGGTIFNYENSQMARLIDVTQSGLQSLDGLPALNDFGSIAFFAHLDDGKTGLFTGPNIATDKIIQTGDFLDSRTVTAVSFFGDINNSGQIAFRADFSDGQSGLYLATPVPEPSTTILAGIFLGLLSVYQAGTTRFAMRERVRKPELVS